MVALRDFRLGAAVFAAEFVLSGAFLVTSSTVVHYALYEVFGGVAFGAVIWAVRHYRPQPALPWLVFAGGIALFIAGDVLTDVYPHWTSPSPADGFYLGAYPLFAAMAVMLVVSSGGYRRIGAIADGLIVTLAFAVFQWILVMSPVLHEHGSLSGKIVLGGLYPFMDILLLGAYAGFFASPAWRTPAFALLVLGMAMQLIGDEATGLAEPSHNVTGTWAAAPWALSYVFWGIAVLHPSMRELSLLRPSIVSARQPLAHRVARRRARHSAGGPPHRRRPRGVDRRVRGGGARRLARTPRRRSAHRHPARARADPRA